MTRIASNKEKRKLDESYSHFTTMFVVRLKNNREIIRNVTSLHGKFSKRVRERRKK